MKKKIIKKIIVTLNIPLTDEDVVYSLSENIKEAFVRAEEQVKVNFPETTLKIESIDEDGQVAIEY